MASVVTGTAVVVGVTTTGATPLAAEVPSIESTAVAATLDADVLAERRQAPSRQQARQVELEPTVVERQYATADLNLWTRPSDKSRLLGEIESGTRLRLTGQVVDGFAEILLKDEVRYVNADYLAEDKPVETGVAAGVNTAPCPRGAHIEGGLTTNAVMMYRAICNAFPAVTVFGGRDPHGEHFDGRAVDFMTYEDRVLGQAIADYARANAAALNIRTVIYAQRIWTTERAGEGWRPMSNRGSVTANHFDHPHISVH